MPELLTQAIIAPTPSLELPSFDECDELTGNGCIQTRKRKLESTADCCIKRCKDNCGSRTPLRVVSDTQTNRQPSVPPLVAKVAKQGCAWSPAEKENDFCDKGNVEASFISSCSEGAGCNEHTEAARPTEGEGAIVNDACSLLSRETLDKNVRDNGEDQPSAIVEGKVFEVPESSAPYVGTAGCGDDANWLELPRPGLWQLSCDFSEAVNSGHVGLWGSYPVQGSLMCPAPIVTGHDQKILVLDMDETLIHASAQELPEVDFKVIDPFGMCASKISVKKRPHVELFLERVSKLFKVIVFTAGTKEYASQVLDQLDPAGTIFAHRLFREHCILLGHFMVKDLRLVTSNLGQVIIVDNTPSAYLLQRENGIHIPSYFGMDGNDCELLNLLPFLENLAKVEDVRPHIIHHASLVHARQPDPRHSEQPATEETSSTGEDSVTSD